VRQLSVPPLVKTAVARLGVERQARAVHRLLLPAGVRQDQRDTAALRRLVAHLLAPDTDCVDVGAHRGDLLADIVRVAPQGRHVAYEPLPELADELRRAFPSVDVRQAALSDRAEERDFIRVVDNPGWSGFRERPSPGSGRTQHLRVVTERLDDALPAGTRPGFVKVDVEGAEREVLAGALGTLREHRPVVAFEHGLGSADYYGTGPDDVWDLLCEQAALRLFDLDGRGPLSLAEFRADFQERTRVNFVAHA
jgi:FkbM family methyltransferase